MEAEKFEIQVRRHPLIALLFIAIGIGLVALGIYISQYGLVIVGALALVVGGFIYMSAALVISKEAVELRNLFGFTGRVIPHDGLEKLQIQDGQLVIVFSGRRAVLPRPKAGMLHPADWKFLTESLEKARQLRT